MYLNSIQIENYAFGNSSFAFKNVDLKFERDLVPSIFPLGGSQGCGKSTLLRIVYDKLTTDSIYLADGLNLQVDDTDKGGVYLIAQDLGEGVFRLYGDGNSCTFAELNRSNHQKIIGSLVQQRIDSLLTYIADIEDSIIFLDNPDLGLHPDQQYALCGDIASLKTSNQFIVATHSFEFCNALTPRHVKELK